MNLINFTNKKITPFQKNILLMFKGTALAQIVSVIGSIFLAKVYGSEAYGIFGVFISASSVFTIVNTMQIDKSIVIVKTENESKNLMNSLLLLTIIISSISFLLYYFLTLFFEMNLTKFGVIRFSIIASLLLTFNRIHEAFLTFRQQFRPISNAKILIAISNILFQLILYSKYKLMGLIYGGIISILLITVYYFYQNRIFIFKVNFKKLKESIISNKSIIKYIFPSTLINSLAINLMPILIVTFFSLKESGVYFLSLKIIAAPLFLISSSISQVYYQKSSELFNTSKEKLFDLTREIAITNILIMLVFIILINTIGIYFLELIFDKTWENLRLFTFILSFLILARSSFNPISNIIIVLNKNHISLLFNIYLLLVNLIAIYFGYISHNLTITIIILSIFGSFGYIALLMYFFKDLKKLKINHG